ncbi:lactonase family protein [Streptomyces tricolor]|nr:lactonase family protein [Streptomyces tricolor]
MRLADRRILGTRSTGGAAPCHLSVHPTGRWLLSANYGSGSAAVHPIDASGALGEAHRPGDAQVPAARPRPAGPARAHQIVTSPDGGHVLAVDLGTTPSTATASTGRRARSREVSRAQTDVPARGRAILTFHPGGRYAYLANELDDTVAVSATTRGPAGCASRRSAADGVGAARTIRRRSWWRRTAGAPLLANRGHNSLARYAVEAGGGPAAAARHGAGGRGLPARTRARARQIVRARQPAAVRGELCARHTVTVLPRVDPDSGGTPAGGRAVRVTRPPVSRAAAV